ncbi:hypothetical protein EYZ11_005203 [Aspergillus tanneri]|uniref:Argonaute complex, subunit Arb1 n=1 Tax=Aspergillus tanneri TaxID=1220188 RepID=A0A4S3JIN9_9EURO|nr:uncharacterized protein ATNIH1004_001394 [Aspergillus tanneri]KAA8652490.1 hypothetical protein ATNIH1004_001394 [Aspergillus tanneri]THC95293.1 hypothetical protein EYZ11_005203 [Aspergillus tanneri]
MKHSQESSKNHPSLPIYEDSHCTQKKVSITPDHMGDLVKSTPPALDGDREGEEGNGTTAIVDLIGPKKKKKTRRKPKSKRGKNKPTGFEEFYVDAPMTPEQYQEEKELYDISRPLIHRMEDALLRYMKNRRIESDRRHVFMRYLAYGGVDVGQKMFAGMDDKELQEMDSEQVLVARGQTSIKREQLNLSVDFNAVVKGYLTSYFPYFFNPETKEMVRMATVTIRNFLSYLLYHDVCPEHNENIDEARKSCDIASKELWDNQQFTAKTPGDFNTACSTLFGGFLYNIYVEDDQWQNPKDDSVRMTKKVAWKVVKFALAGVGTNAQAGQFRDHANNDALRAMLVEDIHGFEVTEVVPPDNDVRSFYQEYAPDLNPVGRLVGKAYCDPGKPSYDLSPEEHLEWSFGNIHMPEFEFFLEEDLLRHCYPGMKVITSVWELNCGFHYFEDIHTTYCSVYTVLCNDLMLGWKKPRDVTVEEGDDDDEGVMKRVRMGG